MALADGMIAASEKPPSVAQVPTVVRDAWDTMEPGHALTGHAVPALQPESAMDR